MIIADDAVAVLHPQTLVNLRVKVLTQKMLISHIGAGEFAKWFRVQRMAFNLSPVLLKVLKNYYNPYGLMAIEETYLVKRFSTLCLVGGVGY